MLAARRDASVTDSPPISIFLEATSYVPSNQSTGDPLTNITGTIFKAADATSAISTNDVDMYGAAYYTSALTDAQIAAMARNGQFVSGYDTAWKFDDRQGSVVGGLGEKTGGLTGTYSWLSPPTTPTVRVVTAAGAVTVTSTDRVVVIKKSTGAATAVSIPAPTGACAALTIKDGKNDAATNNITITAASGNIDSAATKVISTNGGSVTLYPTGSEWFTA